MLSQLDRYKLLEFVMMDLDDAADFETSDHLRDALEKIWPHLDATDVESLHARGMLRTAADLIPFLPHYSTQANPSVGSIAGERAPESEFDACEKSPTGKHSAEWFGNDNCTHCGTGAQPDAPLLWVDTNKD